MRSLFHTIMGKVGGVVNPLWTDLIHYYKSDSTATDSVGTANGTLVNGTSYSAGLINNAFDFDGVNDYVSFSQPLLPNSGDWSFNIWVYIDSIPSASGIVLDCGSNQASTYYWLKWEPGSSKYNFLVNGAFYINSLVSSIGSWKMITITHKESTNYKIYVDGVLGDTGASTANPDFTTANFLMNRLALSPSNIFNGRIDESSFFAKELTLAQVTELYNSGNGLQYI
jgi:hypothetical protein